MANRRVDESHDAVSAREADALLAACRVLVAISVQSMNTVTADVGVTELRMLVVIASRGSVTLSELAAASGLHVSKASRTCDRLVRQGLLDRADDPDDRRNLRLTLTPAGQRIVQFVSQARRTAITALLQRMPATRRAGLAPAMRDFAAAAGEPSATDMWAAGWVT